MKATSLSLFRTTEPSLKANHRLGRIPRKILRWPRISMTGKQGRKSFYKGTGQNPGLGRKSAGTWDAKGRYRLQEHKLRTFVIPKPPFDHTLRPYVAKSTIMTDEVKNQWPPRYKATERSFQGTTVRDLPFDHKVDGHYLLQLGDYFAKLRAMSPVEQESRANQIVEELAASSREVQASKKPDESPAELAAMDPQIETPSEVMKGEKRRRSERNKVATDLEREAVRIAEGEPEVQPVVPNRIRYTGQVAILPTRWRDPNWNIAFKRRPGLLPPGITRIPVGSPANV